MTDDIQDTHPPDTTIEPDKLAQAEAQLQSILLENPHDFSALYTYGLLCHRIGRLELSRKLLTAACNIDPGSWQAHAKLGLFLARDGEFDAALACLNVALSLNPDNIETLFEIGNVLEAKCQHDDARHFYLLCTQRDPINADAWYCLANVLFKSLESDPGFHPDRIDEVIRAAKRALAIKPAPEHYRLIGRVYLRFCRQRAIEAFSKVAEMVPSDGNAYWNMGNATRDCGETDKAIDLYHQAESLDFPAAAISSLMAMHYSDTFGNDDFLKAARRVAATTYTHSQETLARRDLGTGPLRIGYVSGDFCSHPVSFFLLSALANHSERIDVHCFDANPKPDAITAEVRRQRLTWHEIDKLDGDQAVEYIRTLGIDILIDLSGHTAHNRLGVFSRRAAPVQASWLGFFGTTGLPAMDAVIADRVVVPEGEERFFVEKVVRLPDSYLCFSPPPFDVAVDEMAPLTWGNPPTFGSLNNRAKLSERCIALWSAIMKRVPGSRLLLKGPFYLDLELCKQLARQFEAHGVAPSRLVMEAGSRRQDALQTYNRIDVALDPFPFGGGTTTAETLWMGVPVVTLRGDRWVGRVSASMLETVGLSALVAGSEDEYLELAVRAVADTDQLNHWRRTLRRQTIASPLCDAVRFTHNLESAYHTLWQGQGDRSHAETGEQR